MRHVVVAISLPSDLVQQLEAKREEDLPRSLVYRRVLEAGLKGGDKS